MWLYVATAAALSAQMAVEQGAGVATGALLATCAVVVVARFMLLPVPLASAAALSLGAGLLFAALAADLHAPADPHDVLALLDEDGRSATALSLVADVFEPPQQRQQGASAVVEARAIVIPDGTRRSIVGRINLSVHRADGRLRFGDRIAFNARLVRIANFLNPGEFDYARWCARRGVYVSAFVWDDRDLTSLGASPDADLVTRMRVAIGRAAAAGRGAAGAFTAALVVGDMSALGTDVMEAIRISGLTHLLAISGMNVGVVAYVALWLCRQLLALTPLPASGLDPFRPAAVIAGSAVLAYAALSGGGESVVRSTVMSLVALGALWRGSPGSAGRAMAMAALVLCVLSPGSVAEAGFQLSFIATAAILVYAHPLRSIAARPVLGPVYMALVIGMLCWSVTAPILAYDFDRVSLVAPLAGAVTGLPCAVSVIGGLAGALLLPFGARLAGWCFDIASWAGAAVVATARVAALPAWAELRPVNAGPWITSALAALPLVPALPRPQRVRALGALAAFLAVAGGTAAYARYRADTTDAVFASVGQGDAAIVRLAGGKVLVVDGGPPGRGYNVLAPMLRRLSIGRIDYMVATHAQDDHWGGLGDLVEEGGFEIGEFWYPGGTCTQRRFVAFTEALAARGTRVIGVGPVLAARVRAGADAAAIRRRGPGWGVRALWPRDADGACDDNDRSVVVLLRFGRSRILVTGDIERPAEQQLASRPARIRAAVLKAPHHGSRTSSSPTFLSAVRPAVVLASVGVANRYGFPHREVLARYDALGIRSFRTDRDGALRVTMYRDHMVISPAAGREIAVPDARSQRAGYAAAR